MKSGNAVGIDGVSRAFGDVKAVDGLSLALRILEEGETRNPSSVRLRFIAEIDSAARKAR